MTVLDGPLIWATIGVVAVGTYAFRVSFVVLFGYLNEVPPKVDAALRFIPPAVIAAIVVPSVVLVDGSLAMGPGNERLLAATVAAVVALRTGQMLTTIAAGMLTLWGLVFLL